MGAALLWFVVGLAVLLASAEVTVWSAKTIAQSMGISELVIGLTVVAIGTSLPELAASGVRHCAAITILLSAMYLAPTCLILCW